MSEPESPTAGGAGATPPADPAPPPLDAREPAASPAEAVGPPAPAPVAGAKNRRGGRPRFSRPPPRFPWRASLAALAVLAVLAAWMAARSREAPPVGWAVAGDDEAEPAIVRAGDIVRTPERLPGRILLGPVQLQLAPGSEVEVVGPAAARLRGGSLEAVTAGGGAFSLAFGGAGAGVPTATARLAALAPLVLPDRPARCDVTVDERGAHVFAKAGAVDFGGLRLAPGERASARAGEAPVRVTAPH
jgi:hypothetical protein